MMKKKVVYKSKNVSKAKGRFRRLGCTCGQVMFVFDSEFQKLEAARKPIFCISGHPLRIDKAVLTKWPEDVSFEARMRRIETLKDDLAKALASATAASLADFKEITNSRKPLSSLIKGVR